MTPLTPGTNQKMSQALLASFQSFEKEQQRTGIPKGKVKCMCVRFLSIELCTVLCAIPVAESLNYTPLYIQKRMTSSGRWPLNRGMLLTSTAEFDLHA